MGLEERREAQLKRLDAEKERIKKQREAELRRMLEGVKRGKEKRRDKLQIAQIMKSFKWRDKWAARAMRLNKKELK